MMMKRKEREMKHITAPVPMCMAHIPHARARHHHSRACLFATKLLRSSAAPMLPKLRVDGDIKSGTGEARMDCTSCPRPCSSSLLSSLSPLAWRKPPQYLLYQKSSKHVNSPKNMTMLWLQGLRNLLSRCPSGAWWKRERKREKGR